DCALSGGATVIKAAAATAATASVERRIRVPPEETWFFRDYGERAAADQCGHVLGAAARQLCPAGCRGNIRPTTARSGAPKSGTPREDFDEEVDRRRRGIGRCRRKRRAGGREAEGRHPAEGFLGQ